MSMQTTSIGGALLAAVLLAPGLASASYVLDTGTPTSNTGAPVTLLNTSQFVAAEFDVTTANATITQLSAYLTEGVGNVGDTYTIDIYSTSNFTGRANQRTQLYTTTGTFEANGWNSVATNWTPTAAGDYWVALQVSSTTQTRGLDLPGAGITTASATTPSGTAPAVAFAYAGTNGQYNIESTTAPTTPFGIQLTEASPVPLPAAAWLLLSGIGGLGTLARRRRARFR
jgi:hypothetical protein